MEINKDSKTYKFYEKLFNEKSYSLEEIKNIAIDRLVQKDIELFKTKEIVYLLQKHREDLFFKEESNRSSNQDTYTYLIGDKKLYINIPSNILEKNYMNYLDSHIEKMKVKESFANYKEHVTNSAKPKTDPKEFAYLNDGYTDEALNDNESDGGSNIEEDLEIE